VAEAMAFWTAALLRQQLGLKETIFEGDSLEIVKATRNEMALWTNCGPIVEEAKEVLSGSYPWEINHV
jgi:hypothetical protein